ncbi:hypothetical protein B0H19DRAFT_1077201 [Mycena capillaripes]|nr:hypothetical protein B0H19DRAFT_1077201 [Mycena capillaripes]
MQHAILQFKTASLVALAVSFAGAANASALSARAGPVTQAAAAAHVLIHPILDPSLCAVISGNGESDPIVFAPCISPATAAQIWGVNPLDNGHIVQFQNTANNLCFAIVKDPFNGEVITQVGCLNSDGSGRPISNTEFDTSPQTITANNLPIVLTAVNNRIHFSNTGFCMDRSGNTAVVNVCNGGNAALRKLNIALELPSRSRSLNINNVQTRGQFLRRSRCSTLSPVFLLLQLHEHDQSHCVKDGVGTKPNDNVADDTQEEHDLGNQIGVSWTPAGHLAIHTRAPFLATQLAAFFPRFDLAFKAAFRGFDRLGEKCVLDVDAPWTWVVLHGVPAKAFWEVMDSEGQEIWTESKLTSQGYDKEVLTYHPMVKAGQSRDDEAHLTVKMAFTEERSAKRLLAQRGLFLFGAHCRAAKYRL